MGLLMDLDWISFLFISVSLAELAIQTVISDLSHTVMGAILLNQPYNKKLHALSLSHFWRKVVGKGWIIATPIILLIRIHKFFSEMLACPWCVGYHYSWLVFWLYLEMDIITALLFAPVTLVWVTVLDRLHTK